MRAWIVAVVIGAVVFAAVFLVLPGRRTANSIPSAQPAQAASSSPLTQRDRGEGAVEIEVTLVLSGSPDAAKYNADTQTVFLVSMNTHSVDLAGYDLAKVSELVAAGQTFKPTRWAGTSDSSHHRAGALIFAQMEKVDRAAGLELRIKTIAGVPVRVFRWTP
jgi:hypothetical protein